MSSLPYRRTATADTNLASVKVGYTYLNGWYIFNSSAAAKFVKIYDKGSAPVVASDVPKIVIPVPAGGGTNVSDLNIQFNAGIAIAITGAVGDTDATALAANDVVLNLFYQQ